MQVNLDVVAPDRAGSVCHVSYTMNIIRIQNLNDIFVVVIVVFTNDAQFVFRIYYYYL